MQETQVQSLGQEDPLEEEMATYSSILAWRTPWTGDPGGLQSMGSYRTHTQGTMLSILGVNLVWPGQSIQHLCV